MSEARYYRALAKAVPTESVGFSKLCEALEAAGEREQAIAACRDALGREGAQLKDYVRFVHLLLGKATSLSPDETQDVLQIVQHLKEAPDTKAAGTELECEYALRANDVKLMRSCSAELAGPGTEDPATISIQWNLAMRNGDVGEARRLVQLAKAAGVRPEGIALMTRAIEDRGWRGVVTRWRAPISVAGAAVIAASALLFYNLVRRRRGLRPRAA